MSYQIIIIAGNLGRDPEMRYAPDGTPTTSFSVATENQFTKKDGEKVKETTWYRVSVWGKSAESCNQYLVKGSKVLVEGRLDSDPATGGPKVFQGKDSIWKSNYEIRASSVKFLSPAGEKKSSQNADYEQDF
jgi:single-strand DNA-binding protein